MTNGIRHIIWDWNGTLLDDVPACVAALNRLLGRRNIPEITPDRYRDMFGFPVQDYYRRLGMTFTEQEWDELAREFHAHYADTSRDTPLRDGIVDTLERCRNKGIPMSVLSASEISILERMLSERNVRHFFENVCGLSDLYAHSKLDAGRNLMSRIGAPPDRVLFVGDTIHDYEVARDLNCRCVLVAGGHQSEPRLRTCECEIISTPSDLLSSDSA